MRLILISATIVPGVLFPFSMVESCHLDRTTQANHQIIPVADDVGRVSGNYRVKARYSDDFHEIGKEVLLPRYMKRDLRFIDQYDCIGQGLEQKIVVQYEFVLFT